MSTENQPPATPTPADKTPPGAPPPADAAPPPADAISMPSDAFKKRLEEERTKARRSFLKEHGFEDEAAFQSFQKAAKEAADAKLSADERSAKRLKELEPLEEEVKRYKGRFERDVAERFAKLPEEVQKRIDEEAGGDFEKRDAFMRVLGAVPPPAPAPQGRPPAPAPANTSNAPPPPPNTGAPTKWDEYEALKKTNPAGATLFYQIHGAAIQRSRPPTA